MQKRGENLLARTCRSAYSYLNNETVMANNGESVLLTFECHSFHVTPLWVPSRSEYSMIPWTFTFYFSFHTHYKKTPNKTKPKQFSWTINTILWAFFSFYVSLPTGYNRMYFFRWCVAAEKVIVSSKQTVEFNKRLTQLFFCFDLIFHSLCTYWFCFYDHIFLFVTQFVWCWWLAECQQSSDQNNALQLFTVVNMWLL